MKALYFFPILEVFRVISTCGFTYNAWPKGCIYLYVFAYLYVINDTNEVMVINVRLNAKLVHFVYHYRDASRMKLMCLWINKAYSSEILPPYYPQIIYLTTPLKIREQSNELSSPNGWKSWRPFFGPPCNWEKYTVFAVKIVRDTLHKYPNSRVSHRKFSRGDPD
jgi:hypothetical protein